MANRILLVDDDPDVLRGTEIWLTAAGYTTKTACGGNQAVASAVEDKPDAIVMDVRMPDRDGLSAMAELRQRNDTKHIPIVMLSASLVDQQRALDAGARYFLAKPYVGKKLVAAIDSAIGREPARFSSSDACDTGDHS